ncbi:MAG: hypothetical protein J6X94_01605 [Lachnospiraceae bacterium]|nr:hypothetical protein [Lachnospiraceae bacterium]
MKKRDYNSILEICFNICIVIFAGIGTYLMWSNTESGAGLMSSGFANLKYFTVLSNLFCGAVALIRLIFFALSKKFSVLPKLMAASATGLTFFIIAAFLQPLYPDLNLYERGNLYFHLIVPLLSVADFLIIKTGDKIPFRYTLYSASLALIYGTGYLVNILVNGIGEWPESNDWYGFLNWGFPIGIAIFAFVVVMEFGIACLLRFLNYRINKLRRKNENSNPDK